MALNFEKNDTIYDMNRVILGRGPGEVHVKNQNKKNCAESPSQVQSPFWQSGRSSYCRKL